MSPEPATPSGGIPTELPAGKVSGSNAEAAAEPREPRDAGHPDGALQKRLEHQTTG